MEVDVAQCSPDLQHGCLSGRGRNLTILELLAIVIILTTYIGFRYE
jgi:hypothetical protein